MRDKQSSTHAIANLDPEMLAIVEAFAAAIVRLKSHDDDKKAAVEQTAKIALKHNQNASTQTSTIVDDLDMPSKPSGPKLLPINEIADRLSLSRGTIYRKVSEGTFPRPRKLGRSIRWLSTDVDAWLNELPPTGR